MQHRNRYGAAPAEVDPQAGALCGNFRRTFATWEGANV
jgi:hypothetical protein